MKPITTVTELRALPHWVVFRREPQSGGKKPKKIPYTPGTQRLANVSDPGTWRSYTEAVSDAKMTGRTPAAAITPEMHLTLIDRDGCITSDGTIDPATMDLIATLNSYAERSISGNGIHILVQGRPPEGFTTRDGMEVYPRDRNRFVILTENIIDGRDTIEDRTELLAEYFPPAALTPPQPHPHIDLDTDNVTVIERVRRMAKGRQLFDTGDISGYPSGSEADLALLNCFIKAGVTCPDHLNTLFRQSALYPKRASRWDNTRYRDRTIAKALNGYVVPFDEWQRDTAPLRAMPSTAAETDSQTLGFAPNPCADRVAALEQTVARLERENAKLTQIIAMKDARIETLEQVQSATARILGNKSHGPARVVAAAVATQFAWRATAGETPRKEQQAIELGGDVPEGMMLVYLETIAEKAGVSENTASTHLQTLEKRGFIRREVKTVRIANPGDVNQNTGEIYEKPQFITQMFIGPAKVTPLNAQAAIDLANTLAGFSTKRVENRGGKRTPRCPDHPDAPVIREFIDRCGVPSCHRNLNDGEYLLPPMLLAPPAKPAERIPKFGTPNPTVVDPYLYATNMGIRSDPDAPLEPIPLFAPPGQLPHVSTDLGGA